MKGREAASFFLLILILSLTLSGCYRSPQIVIEGTPESNSQTGEIYVHVTGEVHLPGLYKLPKGSRVADAINMAGGATSNGDLDSLNLASPLKDGDKIVVPAKSKEEANFQLQTQNSSAQSRISYFSSSGNSSKININTASAKELESLPGIGPVLAQRIVDYRAQKGGFKTIEEIMEVSGIGEKRFEAIKDLITVK